MSSFTAEAKLQQTGKVVDGNAEYELLETFRYHLGFKNSGREICVPKGFKTNFASIPKILQARYSKDDPRWQKASIIHDFLYSGGKDSTGKQYSRYESDLVLAEAMTCNRKNPTPLRIAILFFLAVRIFGSTKFYK